MTSLLTLSRCQPDSSTFTKLKCCLLESKLSFEHLPRRTLWKTPYKFY